MKQGVLSENAQIAPYVGAWIETLFGNRPRPELGCDCL